MSWLFTGLTILSQILWVLVAGTVRDWFTVGGVLLFFLASLCHALGTQSLPWTARFFGTVLGFGWVVEAVGTTTGLPFGDYSYADRLGPTLGPVPLVIPLAWAMMGYPAYVAASRVCRTAVPRVALAAALLASWDLFLDPQMVSEGHWSFATPDPGLPGVPGIPLTNFVGWAVGATVLMTLVELIAHPPSPGPVVAPPFVLLGWVYFSNVLANAAFFGRPAVALIGAIGMGIPMAVVLAGLRRTPNPEAVA